MAEAMTEQKGDGSPVIVEALAGGVTPPAAGGDGGKSDGSWWSDDAFKLSAEAPDKDTISDASWLENKGFKSFPDMAAGYRSLESRMGGEKVPMPKGEADAEGWQTLWKALGRPDDAAGYDIPVPDDMGKEYADQFRAKAHEIGLLPHQAKALAEWNNTLVAETMALPDADATRTTLRAEWKGDAFDRNIELARRGAAQMQLDDKTIERLTVDLKGAPETLKLLAKIGGAFGEQGAMPGADGQPARQMGGQLTAEQAVTRKQEILKSPELRGKLAAGDMGLSEEWKRIAIVEAEEMERKFGPRQG